jgi:hypothetical protein
MVNAWVLFVKQYCKDKNLSYGCALSMPECSASYKKSKGQKVAPKIDPKDKAHSDLIRIAEESKKMKAKPRAEPQPEPQPEPQAEGTVIKRRSRQVVEVPLFFIKSNLKKGDYTKALKKAEKGSEEAMKYLSSFPDKSRHHYKQLIFSIINDFDEIRRIEDELKETDMSPSMVSSRQSRLKETERGLAGQLEELQYKGFKPMFL